MSQERSHPLVAHCVWVPVKVQEGAIVGDGAVVVAVLQGPAETVLSKSVSMVWPEQSRKRDKEEGIPQRRQEKGKLALHDDCRKRWNSDVYR